MEHKQIKKLLSTGLTSKEDDQHYHILKQLGQLILPDRDLEKEVLQEQEIEFEKLHAQLDTEARKFNFVQYEHNINDGEHYLDVTYASIHDFLNKTNTVAAKIQEIEGEHGYEINLIQRFSEKSEYVKEMSIDDEAKNKLAVLIKQGLKGKEDWDLIYKSISKKLYNDNLAECYDQEKFREEIVNQLSGPLKHWVKIELDQESDDEIEFVVNVSNDSYVEEIHKDIKELSSKHISKLGKNITWWYYITV